MPYHRPGSVRSLVVSTLGLVLSTACGGTDNSPWGGGELGGNTSATAASGGTVATSHTSTAVANKGGATATGTSVASPSGGTTAAGGTKATGGTTAAGGTTSAPAPTGLVGWAAVSDCGPNGTTGGEGGPVTTVTTAAELSASVRKSGKQVIKVSGKINLGADAIQISSDKTLEGINGAEIAGTTRIYNAKNVILRNIKFNGANLAEGEDTTEVTGSSCVWVNHCEFFDGSDGNLDLVRGSDLITVSWSKFYYVARSHSHRLSNLCGNNDEDTPGKINFTFHHNWWGPKVIERMPRVRNGKTHIFNNYYSSAGNNYCVGAGYNSKLVVENNFFDGVKDPIVFQFDLDTAQVVESGNDYSNATGSHVSRGASFKPSDFYEYTLESAQAAKSSVMAGAGVK